MQKKMLYMRKTPVSSGAILYLLFAGFVLFPSQWLGDLFTQDTAMAQSLGLGLMRFLLLAIVLVLGWHMGIQKVWLPAKGEWKALLFALPALVVAVNNLPVIALAQGTAAVTAQGCAIALFAFECLGVGLFEEAAFRGILFPFVLGATGTDKKGRFWGVVIASGAFGLLHLVNLLGGFSGGVFLQVGYSFLIGSMLAICTFRGAGVYVCGVLHAVFNFCGNLVFRCGEGAFWDIWCWQEILLTAAIGVAAAVYFVLLLFRCKDDVAKGFAVTERIGGAAGGESKKAPHEEEQQKGDVEEDD